MNGSAVRFGSVMALLRASSGDPTSRAVLGWKESMASPDAAR
ncbi:hypothetical protein AKJ09_06845 [Labilithrix luteola]|uniref:Uncharacterized protein n=1 Tax=Labilithrix luteola TaxID=1391654 RepID=A0A0K1Q3H4_9BACT|nr:hypothetical protein AKJ09_06845 [Labilithrix luteola]